MKHFDFSMWTRQGKYWLSVLVKDTPVVTAKITVKHSVWSSAQFSTERSSSPVEVALFSEMHGKAELFVVQLNGEHAPSYALSKVTIWNRKFNRKNTNLQRKQA